MLSTVSVTKRMRTKTFAVSTTGATNKTQRRRREEMMPVAMNRAGRRGIVTDMIISNQDSMMSMLSTTSTTVVTSMPLMKKLKTP